MEDDLGRPDGMLDCRVGMPPLPKLCRTAVPPWVLLEMAMDEPRAWPLTLADSGGCRGVAFVEAMESLDLGATGVANGCGVAGTFSDADGEGGVGVSETLEEVAAFAGGVSNDGADASVVVGDNSDLGEAATTFGLIVRDLLLVARTSSAFSSFFLTISVSTR